MHKINNFNFIRFFSLIVGSIFLSFSVWSYYCTTYALGRTNSFGSICALFSIIIFALMYFRLSHVLINYYKITNYEKILMIIICICNLTFLVLNFGLHFTI